jgi:hypothetical protein
MLGSGLRHAVQCPLRIVCRRGVWCRCPQDSCAGPEPCAVLWRGVSCPADAPRLHGTRSHPLLGGGEECSAGGMRCLGAPYPLVMFVPLFSRRFAHPGTHADAPPHSAASNADAPAGATLVERCHLLMKLPTSGRELVERCTFFDEARLRPPGTCRCCPGTFGPCTKGASTRCMPPGPALKAMLAAQRRELQLGRALLATLVQRLGRLVLTIRCRVPS